MHTNWISIIEDNKDIQKQIERLVLTTGKPKDVVIREIISTGLKTYQAVPDKGIQALLDLVEWAEKEHITGPKDLSTNHNKYAWEE